MLEEAYTKASEVERAIKRCVPGAEVTVHLEPTQDGKQKD